jgi:glycosyltransferase involved in cell wall biosynthesis
MIRLFFLVRSLNAGGAERQLIELTKVIDRTRFNVTIGTFYDGGVLRPELAAIPHTTVISLGKTGRWDIGPFVLRLVRAVRAASPDVVVGYMNVANELALLAGRLAGARVVWNLRSSKVDFSQYDRISWWAFRAGAWLSRLPDSIVANSVSGRAYHAAHGYHSERMTVIPNGIDNARFARDPAAGRRLRSELGIAEHHHVVGMVARLDPIKDHELFLRAAARVAARRADVHFLCVGDGPPAYAEELRAIADAQGLRTNLSWAGARRDMPAIYSAMDIGVCCSVGEGFPNVVAEGMAAGVPQVVTDVGDAAAIVGTTGEVCGSRDPDALAAAVERLLSRTNPALRENARARVETDFGVSRLRDAVQAELASVASRR